MSKAKKIEAISASKDSFGSNEYRKTLSDIKKHIRQAQIKAALAANKELIKLYWYIGSTIVNSQKESGWGSNLSCDPKKSLY